MKTSDAAIILAGGRYNTGKLTPLSIQRLDRGYELYKEKVVSKIITLGGHYSTYSPKAIKMAESGAQLSKEYLMRLGADAKDIIKTEDGRDTICEAFTAREQIEKLEFTDLIIVTSDQHMERALWVYHRILGKNFSIIGEEVPCGDILIIEEEKEYFEATRKFFQKFPQEIRMPDLLTWFDNNAELYIRFKRTHDKYHPPGKESQAYSGVEK